MFDVSPYIINISVSTPPTGLVLPIINNLALFTKDAFLSNVAGDTYRSYVSLAAVGTDFGTTSETYAQAQAVFSQQQNILNAGGSLIICPMVEGVSGYSGDSGVSGWHYETLGQAVARLAPLVYFYGIISTEYPASADMVNYAAQIQALNKISALPSCTYSDVAGAFTSIKTAGDFKTRCLYYGGTALAARLFAAAYMSRLLSVDFTGSNTALTMHLKSLTGITVDETLTTTQLAALKTAGVDVYGNFAGLGCVFTSGANLFSDEVYNLTWLVNQLQVNGFNSLRQTNGKVPQTEAGMTRLKNAYRQALDQGVRNGYIAPGSWTSAEVFGNADDFQQNINQRGYYIYSAPVSAQSASDRAARISPLIQIAVKESGALHESSVIVSVNP